MTIDDKFEDERTQKTIRRFMKFLNFINLTIFIAVTSAYARIPSIIFFKCIMLYCFF